MAIIQNASGLIAIDKGEINYNTVNLALYNQASSTYEELYRTQPELRSVIDFLARNIAQLHLHAYNKITDLERQKISNTPLTQTLDRPDLTSTRSKWIDALVKDLAIYDAAFFVKVKNKNRLALVRIPPSIVELIGDIWLLADSYKILGSRCTVEFARDEIIDIHGYNPTDPRLGLSPIETLRRTLAEQHAAGVYRENFWQNSARMGGVIERPPTAPNWSDVARSRFRADFESSYTGAASSGRTVVLEEGMSYKPISYSARDAQYMESSQLSREVVATAYGIPIGLLGLGQTTYSSLTEQHRQLYADCLAPWLIRIQEELELQLLPEFAETTDSTYLEFNLAAKLAGSFTEQAAVLQASVGAPYLTRNEARTRLNLTPVEGGDELVTPLNVLIGGQASPQDSVSDERILGTLSAEAQVKSSKALRRAQVLKTRRQAAKKLNSELETLLNRQRKSVIAKFGSAKSKSVKALIDDVFNPDRFNRELAKDLKPLLKNLAKSLASTVGEYDIEELEEYLNATSDAAAESFNTSTYERLSSILEGDEVEASDIDDLFDAIIDGTMLTFAASLVTSIGEVSRANAAYSNNLRSKTWVVTSGNPRSTHADLDGETVDANEPFSNGANFPGDPALDVEERANCACLCDWS